MVTKEEVDELREKYRVAAQNHWDSPDYFDDSDGNARHKHHAARKELNKAIAELKEQEDHG